MGDASSITIEQLDGDQQKVVLHGPALPFQGAAWKSKQSVVTTWYPGNPQEATQQVLGAQEMPSSWEGMWRRTQMGHTPSRIYSGPNDGTGSVINHPLTLRDVLDQIFFQGSRLKVTWTVIAADPTQPSASITRVGRATEWEFPHDRVHDIAWKITFEWSGRGKSLQKVVSTRDDDSASANAALLAAMDADVATTLGLGLDLSVTANRIAPPSNFNLGQLASIANYPNALCAEFSRNIRLVSGKIKQIANVINTVKNLPFSMSNTLLGSVRNTKSVCATFIDACSATPIEMMNTQTNLRLLALNREHHGRQGRGSSRDRALRHELRSNAHHPDEPVPERYRFAEEGWQQLGSSEQDACRVRREERRHAHHALSAVLQVA